MGLGGARDGEAEQDEGVVRGGEVGRVGSGVISEKEGIPLDESRYYIVTWNDGNISYLSNLFI